MVGDDLASVFLGRLVVTEPGVAIGRVEDPFRVVKHEVIFGVIRYGDLFQQLRAAVKAGTHVFPLFESRLAAGLLEHELHHAVGQPGMRLACLGIGHHVVVAALGQGEPGDTCQCCAQGKDAARPVPKQRCWAVGKCCHGTLSPQSRKDARATLRAALTCAVEEEIITRNPVAVIRVPALRKSKRRVWIVDEARRFLESARHDCDPLYAAYVLIVVLGLRKGEVLGLTWDRVDLDAAELYIGEQLQRVKGPLIRRPVKSESSEAPLPMPELCVTALMLRHERQSAEHERAGDAWIETGLVFTTRRGTPLEPRNFDRRIVNADVPRITRHSTRKTCGSLLAALDVHPRVAMQILRHSRVAITTEIYTEVPSASTREALRKLGQWLEDTQT